MNRKRTVGQVNPSATERRIAELRAELSEAKDDLAMLHDRLNAERERCDQAEKRYLERLRFEELLVNTSTRFVNLPADRIDAAITDAQRRFCEFLDMDRCIIWQIIENKPIKTILSHVQQPPGAFLPESPFDVGDAFPWILDRVMQGESVNIANLETDLPPEATRDRESFRRWGTTSSLVLPLSLSGKTIGAISFGRIREEGAWREGILQRMHLVAQLFTNVLARQRLDAFLESRQRFEALVTEISAHFVNLPSNRIDAEIEDAQRRICECLKVDLSSLWQWSDDDPQIFTITHLHSPPEGPAFPAGIDAQEALPWLFERTQRGEKLIVSTEEMPSEAAQDRQTRRGFGVTTSVILPLSTGGGPIVGVLSFDSLKENFIWMEPLVERLHLIAQIFANALARKRAEAQMAFNRRFETLVAYISTRFINIPADRMDAQIEDAQRRICECIDVDMSTLWQWSQRAPHFMTLTHIYVPPEGPEIPLGIDSREDFPWALEKLLRGEEVVADTEDLPPEAIRDQESRRHFGIKSSVDIPLRTEDASPIGVLTFTSLKTERIWSESLLEKLRLIAQLFTNALVRKRNDLQIRESQERLRMATESAGVGLWVMEPDSGSVWSTPRVRELFQFAEDEALDYASFDRRIDPTDRRRVEQAVKAAIRSGEPLDIEFRILLAEGGMRWIRARGKKLSAANGSKARLMGAFIDISDDKWMEDRLRAQLNEIQSLKQRLEKENIHLRKAIESRSVHEVIVGRSSAMRRVLAQVEQVAPTDTTVLIQGETGTGKDLIARAVHQLSARKDRPMVTVNCASLPPTLIESELFGREKGAYTGALTRMTGRFETADGATMFLDEIGEMPFEVQAKLLRVLEQGRFERLGSTKEMKVDVRIIAATNQNLEKQVAAGRFRKDLYYRLNVFPIWVPPLRERPEDIASLVWDFVKQFGSKMGKRIDQIEPRCLDDLQRYPWPGNIRELKNVIERALIACSDRTLAVLPPHRMAVDDDEGLNLEEVERRHITGVLQQTGWRISGKGGAAEILGMKRTTLQSRMKKLGLRRPDK